MFTKQKKMIKGIISAELSARDGLWGKPVSEYMAKDASSSVYRLNQNSLLRRLSGRVPNDKSWVLGDTKFREFVVQQLARRVTPIAKGGDWKSRKYREMASINLLWPH